MKLYNLIILLFYSRTDLTILFTGPPEPEACWSGRSWNMSGVRFHNGHRKYKTGSFVVASPELYHARREAGAHGTAAE